MEQLKVNAVGRRFLASLTPFQHQIVRDPVRKGWCGKRHPFGNASSNDWLLGIPLAKKASNWAFCSFQKLRRTRSSPIHPRSVNALIGRPNAEPRLPRSFVVAQVTTFRQKM